MPKVLIDIDESDYRESKSAVEIGFCTDLQEAVVNGIVLDGLTNGEKIQKIFPGAKFYCTERLQTAGLPRRDADFDLDFWNRKWGE